MGASLEGPGLKKGWVGSRDGREFGGGGGEGAAEGRGRVDGF